MHRKYKDGYSKYNIHGTEMTLIKYIDTTGRILVKFENGEFKETRIKDFCSGKIRSSKCKTVYGIGYLDGEKDVYGTKVYNTWAGMLSRVSKKDKYYMDCEIDEDWHSFANFKNWFDINYYEVEGEVMDLDKDIIIKGNRKYSKDNCMFLPHKLNCIFLRGVSIYKTENNKYRVRGMLKNKRVSFGTYENYCDAKNIAIKSKSEYIKNVLKEYKDKIPPKIHNILVEKGREFIHDLVEDL